MPKLPSRRRIWAIAYGFTIVATLPLVLIQQGWSSPVAGQREGLLHLKRGVESVDVDSLLDLNQPDFFLRIEMDKGKGASPSPSPEASPEAEPVAKASEPEKGPETSLQPSPRPSSVPYEWLMAEEEAMEPANEATPEPASSAKLANEPALDHSERMRIVADALYHAPRLAQQGHYRQALEVVDAALGVDDQVAHLHALRGSICYKLGRERQAEEGWARALELDPRLTDAQKALDWIRNRRR